MQDELRHPPLGLVGWGIAVLRAIPIATLCFGGMLILLILRGAEKVFAGQARPITPFLVQFVCRVSLAIMGLRLTVIGRPMRQSGIVVANHASWLDIFTLNAALRVCFVAKSEVARWAFIGPLARATGTLFITRKTTEAKRQQTQFEARLQGGDRLLFFPEGTSTDSTFILPFKSTLFAALFAMPQDLWVQPVTVVYHAPKGKDARFYGWYGAMDFAPHLIVTLAQRPQGCVTITLHEPLRVRDYPTRKDLAAATEAAVRSAHRGEK